MSNRPSEFRERLGRVESLVRALEDLPDTAAREAARELVRELIDLHTSGVRRLLDLAAAEGSLLDHLPDDPLVRSLLLLHGLHPHSVEKRVARALERIRPRLHALGGDLELVAATEEVVRLKLLGDPAAGPALRTEGGEAVIEVAPDLATLEFEEAWDQALAARVPLPVVVGGKP